MNKMEQMVRRTTDFAHRGVKLAVALEGTRLGNHISGQLIRCSTSTAANYRACSLAQTRAVFAAKISIVLEEIDESIFWIEFALEEKMLKVSRVEALLDEAEQLKAIFYATRKTLTKSKK
jgi:four helix bundle protein